MKCLACHCFGSALAAVLARAKKALDCAVSLGTYGVGERLLWNFQFIAPKLVSPFLLNNVLSNTFF